MGNLTVKQVEGTKPKSQDVYLRDGDGLELRVYPSGKRAWQFRYQIAGRRRVLALGQYPHIGLKEARYGAQEARKLLDQGIDPIEDQKRLEAAQEAEREAHENRRTFQQALERWVELELATGRKDGGTECLRSMRKDVLPMLGDRALTEVSRGDLVDILDGITARGSRIQANRVFGDLKQFYNWAETREWVDRHPLRGITKERIGGRETERERALSPDELIELRNKLPEADFEPHTEAAIWIMLSTLCRVSELILARWDEVDLETGAWHIPAKNTKNGIEHNINLSPFALRWFKALHEHTKWSQWVMPAERKDDGHMDLKNITRQVRDRMRETPLKNRTKACGVLILSGGTWTPHDLRRSGATLMGELGVLSEIIERCLNHVEPSKLKRTYQRHEYRAEKAQAWRLLGDYLNETLNGSV